MHSTFGGCGYVGRQVACHEIIDGGDVCALIRTVDSAAQLAELGIASRQVDFDRDVPISALQLTDKVVYWFSRGAYTHPTVPTKGGVCDCDGSRAPRNQSGTYTST